MVVKSCAKLSVEIGSLVNYQIFTELLGMDDEENEIKPKQRKYTRQFELGFREEKEHWDAKLVLFINPSSWAPVWKFWFV